MSIERLLMIAGAAAVALLENGCAVPAAQASAQIPTVSRVPVHVTNDSPDLVRVLFISESGHRVSIGTVPPYSKAAFSPQIYTARAGQFFTHRMSGVVATALQGTVEPTLLADQRVLIRIGPQSEFDYWQISQ